MNDEFPVPFGELLTKFSYGRSDRFASEIIGLQNIYEDTLIRQHERLAESAKVSATPKVEFSFPEPADGARPVTIDPINEAGMHFQVLNGAVLGKLGDASGWRAFCFYFDLLLECFETVFRTSCRDYVVQTHAILRLKNAKNHRVMSKLVPSLETSSDFLRVLGGSSIGPEVKRADLDFTLKTSSCEFVFDLKAPANENNGLLWVILTCRSPQEELADPDDCRLVRLEDRMKLGQQTLSNILAGCDFELVRK